MVKLSKKEKDYLYNCITTLGYDLISGFLWKEVGDKLRIMNNKFKEGD